MHRLPPISPGGHSMCPGCSPVCAGARCATSSAVPARSGACSPPNWAASTKLGRGSPGRGCARASRGWRSTRRRRRPRPRTRRAAAQAAPSPAGVGRGRRWSGGAPPEETAATLCAQAAIPCIYAATLCTRGCDPMRLDRAATPCVQARRRGEAAATRADPRGYAGRARALACCGDAGVGRPRAPRAAPEP